MNVNISICMSIFVTLFYVNLRRISCTYLFRISSEYTYLHKSKTKIEKNICHGELGIQNVLLSHSFVYIGIKKKVKSLVMFMQSVDVQIHSKTQTYYIKINGVFKREKMNINCIINQDFR